jgi:hypothetical protein
LPTDLGLAFDILWAFKVTCPGNQASSLIPRVPR